MTRFKVVITDFDYGDNDIERAILEPLGAEVLALQVKSEDDLLPYMADCDAVMNQYERVGAKAISEMKRCKVIARYGIGVDIVDVDAATARGILVTNVRDYCTEEVADHAIALWLALTRKLFQYDRATHQGRLALEGGAAGAAAPWPDNGDRVLRPHRTGDRHPCPRLRRLDRRSRSLP